jgi:glycosyltransferase involved in cell wall biosynthesis
MNWVFLDFIRWDYDVAAPLERPLGGSQSAMSYLALTLARRGERVTTLTGTTKPREVSGVRCLRYENIPAEIFAEPETIAVVVNGPADLGPDIRKALPTRQPLVLWTGHATDQPAVQGLKSEECRSAWDRVICVSEWQRSKFHEDLGVPLAQMEILRNGIAPPFENMFRDAGELAKAKGRELRLAYSSTPYRGLAILLACFPAIHRRHPQCVLDVYSSMQIYCKTAAQDTYTKLYEQCRATAGIRYRGALAQPLLAKELASCSVLAYPSTFAETSCIAVMEAMAAGLLVVTSDLGALSETCQGFGRLAPPECDTRNQEQFAIEYARKLDQALHELARDRAGLAEKLFEQVQYANENCTYARRADEWMAAARGWLECVHGSATVK